jgi:NRAMP (natural resistance-associated macrophage protein)-like metal ion transporter
MTTPDTEEKQEAPRTRLLKSLGPGLVTGAADDDPSGIATYSQAGAQFGTGLLWTTVLTVPLMVSIQLVSARIGWVTGKGLAASLRERYPKPLVAAIVFLLVVANTINLGADLSAMASAAHLLGGGNTQIWLILFAGVSLGLQIFLPFRRYSPILKVLTCSLLVYAAVLFSSHIEWGKVVSDSLLPRLGAGVDYWMMIVAVLGTTISPYLFFWQASQEAEEHRQRGDVGPFEMDVPDARAHLRRIRLDTWVGMLFSNAIAFCIMLTTALALHSHGVTNIETTEQAALALRPLVGDLAYVLFSAGLIGTGLLAVPVLAGSAAYAMAEAAGWPSGLNKTTAQARGFYATLTASVLVGVALNFNDVDPVKELMWAAVVNGIAAVPIMVVTMHMAASRALMGRFAIGRRLRWGGWIATALMAVASVAFLVSIAF